MILPFRLMGSKLTCCMRFSILARVKIRGFEDITADNLHQD